MDRHVDWGIVAPENAGRDMIKAWPLPVGEPWWEDSMSCESNKALTARHYMEVLTQKKLSVVSDPLECSGDASRRFHGACWNWKESEDLGHTYSQNHQQSDRRPLGGD